PRARALAAFRFGGLLPGESTVWRTEADRRHLGRELVLRVRNPMAGGKPLRFANREQQGPVLVLGRLLSRE
ncbi:MAG: hypothetical protein R3236_05940, partial [Phycisphaeraceae bacterium]|nr:hypothetical protein [Phycisphaeraceae bacterium]